MSTLQGKIPTASEARRARNLTINLMEQARKRPLADALLVGTGAMNYRALDRAVWAFTRDLHEKGLRAGQILGLLMRNELKLVLVVLGAIRLGATVFSIPRSATSTQRRDLASQARIDFLATDREQVAGDERLAPVIRVDHIWIGGPDADIDESLMDPAPAAPWLLMSGSGSTGESKLIPLTHGQSAARAWAETTALGVNADDRIASLSHFDFAASKCRLHEAFAVGASIALQPWHGSDPVNHLLRLAPSVVYATVFHAESLLARLQPGSSPMLAHLKVMELTSSTVSAELRARIRRALCPNLHVLYGTNEAGPVCLARPPEVFTIEGTVGKPVAGTQVELVDENRRPVPTGAIGQIRVRGKGLVDGYRDHDDATRQHFQDGWFIPGDLGRFTPDGELVYCGRADHMMIMNGINIYPAEIERVLSTHPGVHDAAAMPIRHPVHQDVPVCAAVLKPGSQISESDLLAWALERLGAHGPRLVLILESIPRNRDGKLARAELREQVLRRLR